MIKKIVSTAVFLLLLGFVLWKLSTICRYSSWGGSIVAEYGHLTYSKLSNLASYPIDVVAFGSSHCNRSFAATELYGQYGMSAYNIGGSWQPPATSYYLLKELLRHEKPKVVLLEVYRLFFIDEREITYRIVLDALPLSNVKIEAINEHCKLETAESKLSYIFNIFKYHNSWNKFSEFGFCKTDNFIKTEYYHGFRSTTSVYKATPEQTSFKGWNETGNSKADFQEPGYSYLIKFIELCKINNIPVILYKDPCTNWKEEHYNAIKFFADSVGVPYIDLHKQEHWLESEFDFSKDLADSGHDNTRGAIKVTRYLGKYIHENYDVPDHRGDLKYKELEAEYERWQKEVSRVNSLLENK